MATYTPNYNLGKPDGTDRYDSFLQLFNDNMDIIDDNLGGGGGGGSYTSEVLYTNSGTSIPSTISLSKGMSRYDMIVFSGYRQQYQTYWSNRAYLASEISTGKVLGLVDDAMYAWYTVTDDTTLTLAGSANIIIDKVYGLKFGGGSSSGGYFAVVNGELCQIYDDGN